VINRLFVGTVGVLFVVAILGCQTAKPALVKPAESAIQVEKSGFSPAAPAGQNSIDISLLYGNGESIKSWKVELSSGGKAQKTWNGDAKYLPASLTWDGKNDTGLMSPEGSYTARLFVEYTSKYQPVTEESKSFVLDVSPPTGTITLNPSEFTPTENGVEGPMTLKIDAHSGLAHMDSWSLDVLDPAGGLVKNWSGKWPNTSTLWDGSSMNGGFVSPSTDYQATATVRDEYGNSAQLKARVLVAALPQKAPLAQTPPSPAPEPGHPTIVVQSAGFSPNGQNAPTTIGFQLGYGQPTAVVSWKVSITGTGGQTEKTYTGDSSALPSSISWDGKDERGMMSPEGDYTASLAVDYGTAFSAGWATSQSFVLDLTPPTGTISMSSELFSPLESSSTISLTLAATSKLAKIDSWTMDIYDPGGNVFRSFTDKWPLDTAVWDGKSSNGDFVQSAEDYPVVARIRDQFGNIGMAKATVPIDILVEKTATGYRILASRIFFKPFTADYVDVPPELAKQNIARLDALAAKLKKFPDYKIKMVGHAVMINWDKPEAGRAEQKYILIPLSEARAKAVRAALVERGLEVGRFTTEGVGASDQLVPDSDYRDRWQNRRVALFLEKEKA